MNIRTLLAALIATVLCACASNPDKIAAAYVSPLKYKDYDCDQIAMEMDYVGQRTNRLYQSLKKEEKADKWQMGVGLLLFWPTLFALEGGDGPEATEYAQLKGEFEALRTTSVQKRCGYDDRTFKKAVAAAAEQPAPQVAETPETIAAAPVEETQAPESAAPPQQSKAATPATKTRTADKPAAEKKAVAAKSAPVQAAPQAPPPAAKPESKPSDLEEAPPPAQEMPFSDNFVGNWGLSISIDQGGRQVFIFDKGRISLSDRNTVTADFENNDVTFVLERDPSQQNYLFTYSFTELMAKQPMLLLDKVPLEYTVEDGYTGSTTIGDENIALDVALTVEGEEVVCHIEALADAGQILEHHLNLWKTEPDAGVVQADPEKDLSNTAKPASPPSTARMSQPAQPAAPEIAASSPQPVAENKPANPAEILGTWEGKTSQGFDITIKTEMVDGSPAVTEMKYEITMSGPAYSATTSMMQPRRVTAKIVNGKFSNKGSDDNISGTFEGNELKGNLSARNVHPQGIGTATADVTFELKRVGAPEAIATSPPGKTTVAGVLVDADGDPLVGEKVWGLFGERYAMKFDDGFLQNPTAKSDENGVFRLVLDKTKFTEEEFADLRLAISYQPAGGMASQMAPLKDENGIAISLNIVNAGASVDLGKIQVKN